MRNILVALAYTLCTLPTSGSSSFRSINQYTFDYIIIGGGTAGLTLANRLSEISNITAAVIEAGKDESNNPNVTSVKSFGSSDGLNTHIDWLYKTTAQRFARDRELEYHSGKAWEERVLLMSVGMTYIRPQKSQIDAWETLDNPGWNWDALWPYYLRSETFTPPTPAQIAAGASYIDANHGGSGPVHVAYQYGLHNGSFASLVNTTWQNLGVQFNTDVNGGNLRGFFVWPQTLDREENVRDDAARAYYKPVSRRRNLVLVEGIVRAIQWAGGNNDEGKLLADGIEYIDPNGGATTLRATKEVILAAGSVRSPAILELSGVGNPEILEPLGIEVKIPLQSVGENALDQPNSFTSYVVSDATNTTFTGIVPYVTYLTADDIFGVDTAAVAEEVYLHFHSWAEKIARDIRHSIPKDAIETLFRTQHDLIFTQAVPIAEILTTGIGNNVGSALFLLLPFSRGNVHVTSSDPTAYPSINPNYFMVDWDLKLQRRVAQIAANFWNTDPVRDIVGNRLLSPTRCKNYTLQSQAIHYSPFISCEY